MCNRPNVIAEGMILLEETIGTNFHALRLGNGFLAMTMKSISNNSNKKLN